MPGWLFVSDPGPRGPGKLLSYLLPEEVPFVRSPDLSPEDDSLLLLFTWLLPDDFREEELLLFAVSGFVEGLLVVAEVDLRVVVVLPVVVSDGLRVVVVLPVVVSDGLRVVGVLTLPSVEDLLFSVLTAG